MKRPRRIAVRAHRHLAMAIALLLFFLPVPLVLASDTGTLVVKTNDVSGRPLPGVIVEISNATGLPTPPAKRTDASGSAGFLLAAGHGYAVRVSLPGFSAQSSVEFRVELSKILTLVFTMQEQLVERVKVGARIVELDEGGEQRISFSEAFVEDLPILGRSYQNVLSLAPGVNDSNGDGNPNVHGARERDFKATVDGVSNVDPLTGTYMSSINPDAIEDIEIVTTGASAEYGGAVGGFGKIITKSGTNAFDGIASIYLRSSFFDGRTINSGTDSDPLTYHDIRPTVNFTGPIVKDKLFFALFHEYIDTGRPINFLGGSGLVVVTKGTTNLDKLTWQVSPRNRLVFQTQSDPLRIGPLGVDGLTDPRSGYDQKNGGPIYQIHWNVPFSSVLAVDSVLGLSHTQVSIVPISSGIKNSCGVDLNALSNPSTRHDIYGNLDGEPIDEDYCFETKTSRRSGSYYQNYSDDRVRYTVKSDASYFLDSFLGVSHTLRAGILAERRRFAARQTLRSFSQFEQSLPSLASGGELPPALLSRKAFIPGLPVGQENRAEGSNYAFYLEDQFRPLPNVSVRAGVRIEQENMTADGFKHFDPSEEGVRFRTGYTACAGESKDPRLQNQCARANFKYFHTYETFPAIGSSPLRPVIADPAAGLKRRQQERFRISNTNPAPRFSISWDPSSDGRTRFFATAGRYFGETFLLIPLYEQPPDNFLFAYQVVHNEFCRPEPDGDGTLCQDVPIIDPDQSARISAASIRQVDRDLRTPYSDEYTVGYTREILPETSLTISYIKRKYRDQFQDIDLNHHGRDAGNTHTFGCVHDGGPTGPLVPIDTTPDGELDDCQGASVPGPKGNDIRIESPDGLPDLFIQNPFFNQVNRIGNFNSSDYRAYTLELKRRLHRDWELQASYVWSKATGSAEDYNQILGNDPSTVRDEFGYLDFDQRHFVKVSIRTQLPVWNLRLASFFRWQSGRPFSATEEQTSFDNVSTYGTFKISYPEQRIIYPSHQRNDQRNEGYWQFDTGVRKDFTIGKVTLEGSLDVFNLFNNDALYISVIQNNRVIGQRSTGRQFQVGARVAF